MSTRLVIGIALAALAATLLVATVPRAESAADRVARLAGELRCPVCQGLSVADSPSDTARQMRAVVEQRVAEGRTDDAIRAEFRNAYGDWIFLAPPFVDPRGAVWLLPIAVIVAGTLVVAGRMGRAPPTGAPSPEQARMLRERAVGDEAFE